MGKALVCAIKTNFRRSKDETMTAFYTDYDMKFLKEAQANEIYKAFGRRPADDAEHERLWTAITGRHPIEQSQHPQ
jgi:hypothetical protein